MFFKRVFFYIVIIISLILRINYEISYADMYSDKVFQIEAAKNFINGNGLSICKCSYENIAETNCVFLNYWPPGYSLLIVPFYYVSGDLFMASIIIDILFIILLYIAVLLLLKLLNVSLQKQIILFIFLGFSYTPFYHLSSTDLISLSIFMWACYFSMYFLKYNSALYKLSLITGFLLFLTGFFRYNYYPIMLAVPFAVLIIGAVSKNKKFIYFSIASGLVTSILLISQTLFIKMMSGEAYRSFYYSGPYFSNLLKIDPFPFKSFFFYEGLLNKPFASLPFLKYIYSFFTAIFSIVVLFEICRGLLFRKKSDKLIKQFSAISIIVLTINVLFLSYMSLTNKALEWQNPPWTFVEETRYYAPSILFFQIIIMVLIFFEQYNDKIVMKIGRFFVYSAIGFAIIYWLNNNYKIYVKQNIQYTFKGIYKEELLLSKTINEKIRSDEYNIFCAAGNDFKSFIYIFTRVDAIIDFNWLINTNKINSDIPANIFVALSEDDNINISKLNKFSPEKIADLNSISLYKIKIF